MPAHLSPGEHLDFTTVELAAFKLVAAAAMLMAASPLQHIVGNSFKFVHKFDSVKDRGL